ncbi:MAG: ABC transporter permease, partial [Pseudomonadota bacterium]
MQKTVQSTGKAGIDVPLDQSTKSLVTRLLRNYLRPHAWRIAAALLCMVVVAISTAAFTQLMKPIINDIFVARNADLLIPVAAMALIVFVAKGLATY